MTLRRVALQSMDWNKWRELCQRDDSPQASNFSTKGSSAVPITNSYDLIGGHVSKIKPRFNLSHIHMCLQICYTISIVFIFTYSLAYVSIYFGIVTSSTDQHYLNCSVAILSLRLHSWIERFGAHFNFQASHLLTKEWPNPKGNILEQNDWQNAHTRSKKNL